MMSSVNSSMVFSHADVLKVICWNVLTIGTLALNNRKSVIALYVDFAKAFDSVSLNKLCHKLLSYATDGNLYSLLENFLADRSQCTRVCNTC